MDPRLQYFVNELKADKTEPYSLRYIGSMIADVHRTIMYGGVYMYPLDRLRPNGKLHILYECAPMAMIVEQAGGEATTGMYHGEVSRILDIEPKKAHDLCPFIVACTRDMNKLRDAYSKGGAKVRTVLM
jgi:fructose-1,6-bisphosphatase I